MLEYRREQWGSESWLRLQNNFSHFFQKDTTIVQKYEFIHGHGISQKIDFEVNATNT